jgi:DNA end-binding protein Ku
MRGHEYLVAIVSDNGVLRADTLRYADEIRTPKSIGLPKRRKGGARQVNAFIKHIEARRHREVNLAELEDKDAEALEALAKSRQKDDDRVIHRSGLEEADGGATSDAKIIDLMAVLRKSLSKGAVVKTADSGPPISLADRRAKRAGKAGETKKKRTPAKSSRRKAARG